MQHVNCIFGCYAIIRDITHCLTQPVRVQGNVEAARWYKLRRLGHSQRKILLVKHIVLYLGHSQRKIASQCLHGAVFILQSTIAHVVQ